MGCLGTLIQFILLSWALTFVWNKLLVPLFGKGGEGAARPRPGSASAREGRTRYLRLLMPLLAKIAKADGRVSESEISGVEAIFRELGLSAEERRFAAQVFSRSKDSPEQFDEAAIAFAREVGNFELRVITFQYLVRVACADGELSPREREMALRAARCFGIPDFLVARIFAAVAGDFHGWGRTAGGGFGGFGGAGARRPPPRPSEPSRAEDLALLGLGPGASDDDIRRAYRRKVKELHPDRLQAQGLPEAMLKQATARMAAINAAYSRLIK